MIASRVFDSITLLKEGIQRFRDKCVKGITADTARNEQYLTESMAVATALIPTLGYAQVMQTNSADSAAAVRVRKNPFRLRHLMSDSPKVGL